MTTGAVHYLLKYLGVNCKGLSGWNKSQKVKKLSG